MIIDPEGMAERLYEQHQQGELTDEQFIQQWAGLGERAGWHCVAGQREDGGLILTTWDEWRESSLAALNEPKKIVL